MLLFLSFTLPSVDRFNRLFQKSTENTTSQVYDEMIRLVRLYASNFLTSGAILAASDNLRLLELAEENQVHVCNEDLGIGTETWVSIAELEATHDTAPLFKAEGEFYVASTKKMLNKFPFGDTLMKDLSVLQPEKTSSFPFSKVISLAERFPQIGLSDSSSLDRLNEEFQDFKLSPGDLPSVVKYKTADGVMRSKAGLFWSEVRKITNLEGQTRFSLLHQLMAGLLSIPVSNADSESGLRKIHIDQ